MKGNAAMKRTRTKFEDRDGGHAAIGHAHSFGWSAAIWEAISVGVAAAGVGASVYTSSQATKTAHQAQDQAKANAAATAKQADEANNRANAKSPDSAAALAANILAGKSGASGTMLTGPGGIDPSQLTLGRQSLLGL